MFQLNATLPEFLAWQDGEVRICGHRIGLYDLVKRHQKGETVEEIAQGLPSLSIAEVRGTLDFCVANRAAVEAYVAAYEAELRELEGAHSAVDLRSLRRRFRDRQADNPAAEAVLHTDAEHGL